jgi:YVTN family beta-propeller protein
MISEQSLSTWLPSNAIRFVGVGLLAASLAIPAPASASEPGLAGVVYTADEKGGSISVIDVRSGRVETIPVSIMPHNVQISADGHQLYAVGMTMSQTNTAAAGMQGTPNAARQEGKEAAGKLQIFDSERIGSGPVGEVAVGPHPAHVVASADGKLAFVTDSEKSAVLVVDLANRKVVRTVKTDSYPHGLRLSPDGGELFVANVKGGTVSVIDTAKLVEAARIKVGKGPVQVGFAPDGRTVLVSLNGESKVAIIDRQSRQLVEKLPVGRNPVQVYATPDGRYAYVANQGTEKNPDNTVSVIDMRAKRVAATVVTGKGAHGVVVSDDGKVAFVSNIVDGTVSAIDTATSTVIRSFKVGASPNGITFRRDAE